MLIKEYVEKVLDKESTHFIIARKNEVEQTVTGSLVILIESEKGTVEQVLASDRYYKRDLFNLTEEEWQELSE
jgi:hypothetical protein